jgi:hypothetical protein
VGGGRVLTDAQKAAGATTPLRFVYTFDAAATNDLTGLNFSGLSDEVVFTVNAPQRAAGTYVG